MLGRDPFRPAGLLVAQPQHFFRRIEEIAQQLALPPVPYTGTDRTNIDHRQRQQQPQAFGRLNHCGKIEHGLEVRQVTLECGRRHQQVIADQPGDGFGLDRCQPQSRAKLGRNFGTQHAVVTAAPLGDVMHQDRGEKHAPHRRLAQNRGHQRVILGQNAALDTGQQAYRADRMFIDSVVVVHVELHLCHDAPEIGHKATEYRRLVHPAQHGFGVTRRREYVHEQRVGARVDTDTRIDQPGIPRRRTHRRRVNFEALGVGNRKNFDQANRIGAKPHVVRYRQPPTIKDEAVQMAGCPHKPRQTESTPLGRKAVVEMGKEHPGQITDRLCRQEIMLHEPFDGGAPRSISIAHPARDFGLHIERQPLLGAPRDAVQVAPHRPQEILCLLELAQLGGGQQPLIDQLGYRADAV